MRKEETALYIPKSRIENGTPTVKTVDNRGRVYVGKKLTGKTYQVILVKED